ncbi:MAG: FAD-dependent oxidoreductase [Desulfobacterales bacterium]|nr:FAD-dependent oxidoreductase [Desulfobacterales bacterium]
MIKSFYHIVIVGAGMAGLSAARTLSGHGLDILVIDENPHAGGQLIRRLRETPSGGHGPDPMKSTGFGLIQSLGQARDIDWLNRAQVMGIFSGRRLLVHTGQDAAGMQPGPGRCREVRAGRLILAAGARERYLPFPGWTLPGVLSLGAAQILMKSHGVLPARHTLIAGSSPLMMVLASELLSNKGKVTGVVDETAMKKKLAFLPLIRHHWPKLAEGGIYASRMALNRVTQFRGFRIIEAKGRDRFESAVISKINSEGEAMPGTQTRIEAEALAMGYGFVPNIELGIQAGCKTEYQADLGGWIIATGTNSIPFETSLKNIFAIGELTGIGGAKKSHIQGRLAAMSILAALGKAPAGRQGETFTRTMAVLRKENNRQQDYARFLNRLTRLPDAAYAAIPDETLICRCESVTMGCIKKRIAQGFDTAGSLKKATRSGMGRCQGRICGPVIFDIITALTGNAPDTAGTALSRAPVKNMDVRSFLNIARESGG